MNDYTKTWYMQELAMHALGARSAFAELATLVRNPATRQNRHVWFQLVSFLGQAAMISKYLDPVGRMDTEKQARVAHLRQELGIQPDSLLPRDARNNLEHFDERIDNWDGTVGTIVECVFQNRSGFEIVDREGTRIKRVLLVDECVFISECHDQSRFELSMIPLIDAIGQIGEAAELWIENSSPYHFIGPN
jgi:hypothetical protein